MQQRRLGLGRELWQGLPKHFKADQRARMRQLSELQPARRINPWALRFKTCWADENAGTVVPRLG